MIPYSTHFGQGGQWAEAAVSPNDTGRGAGAEMRRALGLAVFSGMLGVTFFGVFLTPVFFSLLRRHSDRAKVAVQQKE